MTLLLFLNPSISIFMPQRDTLGLIPQMQGTFHRRLFLHQHNCTLMLYRCWVYFNSILFFSRRTKYYNYPFNIFSIAYPISNLRCKLRSQISIRDCLVCLLRHSPITSRSNLLPTIVSTKCSQIWSSTSGSVCSLESLNCMSRLPLSSQASHDGLHPYWKIMTLTSTSHSEGSLIAV